MLTLCRTLRLALTVLALALSANRAEAQNPQTRQGFGISFGLGLGSGAVSCDGCDSNRETGLSGYLRLGGYVNPSMMVAFESNGFAKSKDGIDVSAGFYSAAVQWYPNASNGLYLKGGFGVLAYMETDGLDELTVSAPGLSLGIGNDFRVGKNFSLTPYGNLIFSGKSDAKLNGTGTGFDVSMNLLQFGLGLTWH